MPIIRKQNKKRVNISFVATQADKYSGQCHLHVRAKSLFFIKYLIIEILTQ